MQQNVSPPERFASVALGSLVLARSLFSKQRPLSRLTQTVGGAGLIWRGLSGFCPVYSTIGRDTARPALAHRIRLEKTIMINKTLDEVREILGEGDPVWRSSDSTLLPMTAGKRLWDLHLREADSRRTLIHASLTNPDAQDGLHGKLQTKLVMEALEAELRKLKALIETGEIPTTEGQPTGRRSQAVKTINEVLQDKLQAPQRAASGSASQDVEATI